MRGAATSRQGFTQGPILAICCLGLILLLISATFVLALIPVYLSRRDVTLGGITARHSLVATPQSTSQGKRDTSIGPTIGNDGTLDSNATSNITGAVSTALGFPSDAFTSDSNGVVATSTSSVGKRKRRGFGLIRSKRDDSGYRQRCYFTGGFRHDRCGECKIRVTVLVITVIFTYDGIIWIVTFDIVIIYTVISIPPTLAPSITTTTISHSNSTTTTTATSTLAMG